MFESHSPLLFVYQLETNETNPPRYAGRCYPNGTSSRGRVGQSVLRCSDRRTSAVPARTTAIPASTNRATVSGFPAPAASVDTVPRKSVTVSRALTAAMFSSSHVDGAPVLLRRLYLIRTIFGDILPNCFGMSHRHVPGSTTARSPTPPLCVGSRDDCVSTDFGSPVPSTVCPYRTALTCLGERRKSRCGETTVRLTVRQRTWRAPERWALARIVFQKPT